MVDISPYIYKQRLPFGGGGGVSVHSRQGQPPFMLGEVIQRIIERKRQADLEERQMALQERASPIEEALKEAQTILAQRKAEQVQKMPDFGALLSGKGASADYETGYSFSPLGPTIRMTPKPAISPATQERIDALGDLETKLDKIDALYDPSFIGFAQGRVGRMKEKTTGVPGQQATFYQLVQSLADDVLRARSGAQINEQEMQRMLSFLPHPNLPETTFKARVHSLRQELASKRARRLESAKRGGKRVSGLNLPENTQKQFLKTATNPKTGEKMGFDGQKWVPIK